MKLAAHGLGMGHTPGPLHPPCRPACSNAVCPLSGVPRRVPLSIAQWSCLAMLCAIEDDPGRAYARRVRASELGGRPSAALSDIHSDAGMRLSQPGMCAAGTGCRHRRRDARVPRWLACGRAARRGRTWRKQRGVWEGGVAEAVVCVAQGTFRLTGAAYAAGPLVHGLRSAWKRTQGVKCAPALPAGYAAGTCEHTCLP